MENKYYGVKVPFVDEEGYLYVTYEGGSPWHTTSLEKAKEFAKTWSSKAVVVELTEEDL